AIALMGIGDAEQPELRTRRGVDASRLIFTDPLPPLSSSSEVAASTALVDEHSRISADVGGLDIHAGVVRGADPGRRRVVGVAIPAGALVVAALFTGWIALRPTSRQTVRTVVALDAQGSGSVSPTSHPDSPLTVMTRLRVGRSEPGRTIV